VRTQPSRSSQRDTSPGEATLGNHAP
jgi:hypothetical protein